MNETLKNKIKLKKSLHKSSNFNEIQKLSTEIFDMILKRKEKYYHHLSFKFNNPNTSTKTYWSIAKCFCNYRKVPLTPPLLVNNKIVSDSTKKAYLFNDFFAAQCTLLTNSSVLPSTISFKTHSRLKSISFEKEDILQIISNLGVNKAQCHDDISIPMLKICDSEVVEPLSLIYKNCIDSGIFPDIRKRSHIILTYKKNYKCIINIYRPVSLLPICGKIFERIICNPVILYLEKTSCLLHISLAFTLMTLHM